MDLFDKCITKVVAACKFLLVPSIAVEESQSITYTTDSATTESVQNTPTDYTSNYSESSDSSTEDSLLEDYETWKWGLENQFLNIDETYNFNFEYDNENHHCSTMETEDVGRGPQSTSNHWNTLEISVGYECWNDIQMNGKHCCQSIGLDDTSDSEIQEPRANTCCRRGEPKGEAPGCKSQHWITLELTVDDDFWDKWCNDDDDSDSEEVK